MELWEFLWMTISFFACDVGKSDFIDGTTAYPDLSSEYNMASNSSNNGLSGKNSNEATSLMQAKPTTISMVGKRDIRDGLLACYSGDRTGVSIEIDFAMATVLPVPLCTCQTTIHSGWELSVLEEFTPSPDQCGSILESYQTPKTIQGKEFIECRWMNSIYTSGKQEKKFPVKSGDRFIISALKLKPPYNTSYCVKVTVNGPYANLTVKCEDMLSTRNTGTTSEYSDMEPTATQLPSTVQPCHFTTVTVSLSAALAICVIILVVITVLYRRSPNPQLAGNESVHKGVVVRHPSQVYDGFNQASDVKEGQSRMTEMPDEMYKEIITHPFPKI